MTKALSKTNSNLVHVHSDPDQVSEREQRELHYNYLQLIALLIRAQYTTCVAGRGTGKSEGVLAPYVHDLASQMARGSFVCVGTTYIQLLDRTLPALWNGLQRLGYQRDVDYWVRRFPDKKYKLDLPYNCPLDPQHSIFIRNANTVSVLRLVGQDRPGTANGLSVNAIFGDEAKFLNKEKLDSEVMAINRGDNERFGHSSLHHSTMFTTDMPTTKSSRWILDAEKECLKPHHQEAIRLILSVQLEIYTEKQKLAKRPGNQSALARIRKYEGLLNELRKGLVHFAEASSFANVHALGFQYFKTLFRTLRPSYWKANVLNIRVKGVQDGFYPHLRDELHYYDSIDYAHVDKFFGEKGFNDCRKDGDIDHDQPLTIGMDYGSSFNCMVVGQRVGREVRYLKIFYAPGEVKIQSVVKQFCDYYRYFYKKRVKYVYNHTAIGTDGKSDMTYADEVIKVLRNEGWKVEEKYTGQTESPMGRYLAWGVALSEEDDRFPRQRFNRENTRVLVDAMHDAGTVDGGRAGFKKDKKDERDQDIDQSTTTHLTDAVDEVFWQLTIEECGLQNLLPMSFSS